MSSFWLSLSGADRRDIVGLSMVAIGVAGELLAAFNITKKLLKIPFNPTNFPPLDLRKKWLEIGSAALIVIGLGLEVSAWPSHIKEVESLKNENLRLQIKLQPRIITTEQIKNFIFLTERMPKIRISVGMGSPSDEVFGYAYGIRQMFSQAGYMPPDEDTNYLRSVRNQSGEIIFNARIGVSNEWPDIIFFTDDHKDVSADVTMLQETNGFYRPYIEDWEPNFTNKIYVAFRIIFRQIGITNFGVQYTNHTPFPNHREVFIMKRPS